MSKEQPISAKLRRLGVVRGTRHLKPAPPPDPSRLSDPDPDNSSAEKLELSALLPGGRLEETALGQTFILDDVFPLHQPHGRQPLGTILQFQPQGASLIARDERFQDLDYRDFVFLDTETTGLAGAGTIAFMVGVAFFEGEALVTRQYFVPDFGEEGGMLELLLALLANKAGLITFNGRTFDLPLLDNRLLMNRLPGEFSTFPHLDLLQPARRLWRQRLGSVALSALETGLLGVKRSQADVPGWLIPGLYTHYIRTGDAREMARVFYHNQIDLLSMVTLTATVQELFQQPQPTHDPIDLYSLGRWQAALGLTAAAEQSLGWAAAGDLPLSLYHQNLYEMGRLYKRHNRRAEALPLWQQIAATTFEDVVAHVELAKYYEWHDIDRQQALYWTEAALSLVQSWPAGERTQEVQAELDHRRRRLLRKIGKDES